MWKPEPDELYRIGENSTELGQRCAACRQPFELGDVITWRPWPPEREARRLRMQALHLRCLPADKP